jgi:hypothetical protein
MGRSHCKCHTEYTCPTGFRRELPPSLPQEKRGAGKEKDCSMRSSYEKRTGYVGTRGIKSTKDLRKMMTNPT